MSALDPDLDARLRAAGIDPDAISDPGAAWLEFRTLVGPRATLPDRYALEAAQLGVAPDELDTELRARLTREVLRAQFPDAEWIPGSDRTRDDPIDIVDYDPAWARHFSWWRKRLDHALGSTATRIDHVGSTAVPGLGAKPIVDIQVSVIDIGDENAYVPHLEALGVTFRMREPEHRYFRTAGTGRRTEHVHVCQAGSTWERSHLLFRDFLRADAAARGAYGSLKRELALRYRDDRVGYTDAKSGFILDALERAERWAARVNWQPDAPAG